MTSDYWADLTRAIEMLSWHKTGAFPFHCEHDQLYVMSDPSRYSPEELAELEGLGFDIDEDVECFTSFRYGSACDFGADTPLPSPNTKPYARGVTIWLSLAERIKP